MPLIRADGEGYTYAGERVDGFADRPDLPVQVRVRLARLGERYAPKKLSATQRKLLASPMAERDATRQPSPELDGFQANALDAERAWEEGVYAELSPEQQEWVSEPSSHPSLAADTHYPLTLGQLHLLSDASERQLRHWTDEDLIPAHRAGTHRRYYSAAVARTLLLAQMSPQQVAALIALRHGGDRSRRLWVLIGSVTASLADTDGVGESDRTSIRQGAQALVDHRGVLASAGSANIRSRTVRNGKGTFSNGQRKPAGKRDARKSHAR
jgi:DNA-binding transcriptional MerR regulator